MLFFRISVKRTQLVETFSVSFPLKIFPLFQILAINLEDGSICSHILASIVLWESQYVAFSPLCIMCLPAFVMLLRLWCATIYM